LDNDKTFFGFRSKKHLFLVWNTKRPFSIYTSIKIFICLTTFHVRVVIAQIVRLLLLTSRIIQLFPSQNMSGIRYSLWILSLSELFSSLFVFQIPFFLKFLMMLIFQYSSHQMGTKRTSFTEWPHLVTSNLKWTRVKHVQTSKLK
jgi:hypothetical protein